MNDFTKEELEILRAFASNKESSTGNRPYQYLADKIQSMIDNYCEHADEYEDFNYSPMRCKKCLEITG